MPQTICDTCGGKYAWSWTDAFDKFGFGDGDGQVMTHEVAHVLRDAGYEVETNVWGCHNVIIDVIRKDGRDLIPASVQIGYADPRRYLPKRIIRLLDRQLPDAGVLA
jgi:hypothetical protein